MSAKVKFALAALTAGLGALAIASVAPRATMAAPGDAEVSVDLSARYQTMAGWEVTLRAWEQNKTENRYDGSWLEEAPEIAAMLVDDVGINRVRLEVRSNTENTVDYWTRYVNGEETQETWSQHLYDNVNDNDDPQIVNPAGFQWSEFDYKVDNALLPIRDWMAARGERLFISLCFVDFNKGNPGTLNLAARPEEYAELIAATFDHLKEKYGLTPDALEIVLEPENSGPWRPERIGPAIKAVTKRLDAMGVHPQIIAPSTKLAKNAVPYFNAAQRSGAKIDVIAYHSYDRPADTVRQNIAWQAKAAGVETAMLEHLGANVEEFYRDMTIANVSAWQQWAIASLKDDGSYLLAANLAKPKGERLRLGGRTRLLSQIWRHARIGDVRIGAAAGDPSLKPLAFVRPDGGVVVSVIVEGPQSFSVTGLPPGSYAAERTLQQKSAENLGTITVGNDGRAALSMPARGVITIVQAPRAAN